MILDGAKVIAITKKDDFGVIRYSDDSLPPIPVKYLAICQYEKHNNFYVFLCDENYEVQQDNLCDTFEEAMECVLRKNKNAVWVEESFLSNKP